MAVLTEPQIQQLLDDYRRGVPVAHIATSIGVTSDAVLYHVRKRGLPKRPRIARPQGHRGAGSTTLRQQRAARAPVDPRTWVSQGACLNYDVELFFPTGNALKDAEDAIAICDSCPVREQCLEHALAVGEEHGVWGGTVPLQRTLMRKKATA